MNPMTAPCPPLVFAPILVPKPWGGGRLADGLGQIPARRRAVRRVVGDIPPVRGGEGAERRRRRPLPWALPA